MGRTSPTTMECTSDVQQCTSQHLWHFVTMYEPTRLAIFSLNHVKQDIGQVLRALSTGNQGASTKSTRSSIESHTRIDEHQHTVPKLESLILSRVCLCDLEPYLLGVAQKRLEYNPGLKELVVRSCWIYEFNDESKLGEVADRVEWEGNIALAEDDDLDDDDPEVTV